jgi:hypothetical protein
MRAMAFLAAMVLVAGVSVAAEKGEWVELFDGKTLDGWKVIGCEAEVKDGAMLIKAGDGVVRPERKFKDYVLELDWKALQADNWDSGVYFRCIDPAGNYPWPRQYQVNMRKGMEGNVDELKGAKSQGLTKAGEWNHFKLTVVGTKAELEINGKPAWKADGLKAADGFISLQAEVPGGGQFLFKNIRVMELTAE